MPIPQIVRVDPLDLQKSRAIGVSVPFNGGGVFNKTYSTKAQIKSNLINLLLTSKKERINNLQFGSDLKKLVFEPLTDILISRIKETILTSINTYIPQIVVLSMDIIPNIDEQKITVNISYKLSISQDTDKLLIDFSTLK